MVSPFKIQACVEIHFSMRSYSECSFFANFHLVLVKLMCPALSARIFDWAVEAIWIWHFKRKAASWSPIKHWCRHVRPTDWEVGHPCYNRSPHSTGLLYHILWSHEGKMNATLHVYCFFPVPGSYTIAYFVSDALTFSIFDHDAFVSCVQSIGLDIAFTSAYKKKKLSFLKLPS